MFKVTFLGASFCLRINTTFSFLNFKLDFTHRVRLEQRYIGVLGKQVDGSYAIDSFRYQNRIRYQGRTQIPLKFGDRKNYLALSDEVFFNFGKNVDRNVFDQNRATISLGRDLGHQTKLELGFMEQTVQHRDGLVFETPGGAIYGPKAMLIDQDAGSGGDFMPYAFKRVGLGPLIGKRTWGGLVGINGGVPFVDGGVVTAPEFGLYDTATGKWIAENRGVEPDVDIDARTIRAAETAQDSWSRSPASSLGSTIAAASCFVTFGFPFDASSAASSTLSTGNVFASCPAS